MQSSIYFAVIVACVTPLMTGCLGIVDQGRQTNLTLAPHHSSCLARGLPVNSPEHTDCVLRLYQERQLASGRMREAVAPTPPSVVAAEQSID